MMSSCESVSCERLAVSSQRLCRPDARKGCAFPESRSGMSQAPRLILLLLTAYCLLLTSACRRDMQDQPQAIAYRENTLFRNGLSSRTLVPGTVPRGYLRADREFYLGKKANSVTVAAGQPTATQTGGATTSAAPTSPASLYPDDVETFPIPLRRKILNGGRSATTSSAPSVMARPEMATA